jgi:branched-chain amino acid transport system permease protein
MSYIFNILIVCEIYLILALAMNLLAGYSGLLSLSQAAFYGTGAYATALLLTRWHFSFPAALLAAILFSMVCCLPVIWFAIRLRDLFFTLATLSWQIVVFAVLYNWNSVTNGAIGITGIPKPNLLGVPLVSGGAFAVFGGVVTVIVLAFFLFLQKTPFIRVLQGIRDDQLAMMTFGKRPGYYKAVAILISSAVAAIAGALFATYYSFVDPTSFTFDESILILSIVLIGGLGSIRGAVAGALFYVLLPEALRFLAVPDNFAANLRMMIYALVLILVVRYRPNGFFGKYKFD